MSQLAAVGRASGSPRHETPAHKTAAPVSARREVVPVAPAGSADKSRMAPLQRANAPYLAHLIATSEGLPQTRERRRASPGEAAVRYTEAAASRPLRGSLLRSL